MKISPILTQLRDYCPSLAQRVSVGIDPPVLQSPTPVQTPCALVRGLGDRAAENQAQNATCQIIRDRFAVLLVVDATQGAAALDQLHELRAEVWRALVGFRPGSGYAGVEYGGGEWLALDAQRGLYQLDFFAECQLGRRQAKDPAQTWQEHELDGLPSLSGVTVRVDAIDPADPNLQRPGPDGRLEVVFSGELNP